MLSLIADRTPNRSSVRYVHLDRALEATGQQWPSESISDENVGGVIDKLNMPPSLVSFEFGGDPDVAGWRRAFGFSAIDTNAVVEVDGAGIRSVQIFATEVDAAAVAAATSSDPDWSSLRRDVSFGAVTYMTWGDDPTVRNIGPRSSARKGGQGYSLAVLNDGVVVRSEFDKRLEDSLNAAADVEPSLADDAGIALVAERFDAAEVYAANFTNRRWSLDPISLLRETDVPASPGVGDLEPEQVIAIVDGFTILPPYEILATGQAVLEGEFVEYVAFVMTTEAEAQQAVSDFVAIVATSRSIITFAPYADSMEILATETIGHVGFVTLQTQPGPSAALSSSGGDSLFASE